MKKGKKLLFTLLALAVIIPVSVFAAEQRYQTYLKMGGYTYLEGQYRNYEYKNHKIEFHPTKTEAGMYGSYNKLGIKLIRKNFIGTTEVYNNTTKFTVGSKDVKTVYTGSSKAGTKHRYDFYTGIDARNSWGTTWADPVFTYSY